MKIYCNFMDGKDFEKAILPFQELYNKPISVFIDYIPQNVEQLSENPVNILMIMEPNQLFGLHDWAIAHKEWFSCILTWSDKILSSCDNAAFFPFGVTWLNEEYINKIDFSQKNFEVSFLCGAKQMIEGHHLRHRLYKRENEIKIPKKWFYTLEDYNYNGGHHTIAGGGKAKEKCWNESMYSICVENSSNNGYFTEKIIDAFLTKTIPIYWGCPTIGKYYDLNGMIHCKDENEIIEKVNSLTPDFYNERKEVMLHNLEKARHYGNITGRFVNVIRDIVNNNDI